MLSITPDQLGSAGSYIAHEWGDYGYRFTGFETYGKVTAGFVSASDGSRFTVLVDRWSNVDYVDTHSAPDAWLDRARAMHEKACAS